MPKEHHIIYLPGLGDHSPRMQIWFLRRWHRRDLVVDFMLMKWTTKEPLETKLKRITDKVDELAASGKPVSLVGVSAGASAALNIYCRRPNKISGVVYVCGKMYGKQSVSRRKFRQDPRFRESLELSQKNISKITKGDKDKMLSLHPIFDEAVAVDSTKIEGIRSQTIPAILHMPSIFLVLTVYKKMIIGFLENRAKND